MRARLAPWNWFEPSSKIFLLTVPRPFFFCGSIVLFICLVSAMPLRLFIAALWSTAGKGLTSRLLFVVFNFVLSLSHVVSWVWCGTWLYRFLILAPFLTFMYASFKGYGESAIMRYNPISTKNACNRDLIFVAFSWTLRKSLRVMSVHRTW